MTPRTMKAIFLEFDFGGGAKYPGGCWEYGCGGGGGG
jgi:hypothetical protein